MLNNLKDETEHLTPEQWNNVEDYYLGQREDLGWIEGAETTLLHRRVVHSVREVPEGYAGAALLGRSDCAEAQSGGPLVPRQDEERYLRKSACP